MNVCLSLVDFILTSVNSKFTAGVSMDHDSGFVWSNKNSGPGRDKESVVSEEESKLIGGFIKESILLSICF